MTVIEIRGQAFVLVGPNGQEETLASPALQGVRAPEIELINKNLAKWVGSIHGVRREQVVANLVSLVVTARGDVRNRAFPRATDGRVLPPINGARYEEISREEIGKFAEVLYEHICVLTAAQHAASEASKKRRWPFGRR